MVEELRAGLYFKRTLIRGQPRKPSSCPVHPFPFSSMWDIPWVPWRDRTTDVFCVFGMTQAMRPKVKALVEACAARHGARIRTAIGHPLAHPEYLKELANSKIVIDHQGRGSDTMRTWEAFAAGACVFTDMQLEMPAPLEPNRHFVHYPRDEHHAGVAQDLGPLELKLDAALRALPEVERIARAGYDQVRAFHTTKARAQYLLDMVRAC